jgi:glucokinase
MGYWVGFDLGGTKQLAEVFDNEFKTRSRVRKKTRAHEGAQAGIDRITDTISEALKEAKISAKEISGIGIGVPGLLDLDRGLILDAPNLGWSRVALREELEKAFKCPVVISNDVDAGVFGEYKMGAAKNMRSVVGIFPGTGIGGGFVFEGKMLRGKHYSALEIGHVPVVPNGPLCGCGQRGCLEAVASRLAISAAAAIAASRGEAPYLCENVGCDVTTIRSGALADSIKNGDKVIEKIVRDAAAWIGVGVAIVVNLLGPELVVLGGGLIEAMPELFCEEIEKSSRNRCLPAFRDSFKLAIAKLGDDATAVGAAAWAQEVILSGKVKNS